MRYRIALFFLLIPVILTPARAESPEGHLITSLSHNAWITHGDSSTPSSASVGDLLQNGDRLETLRENTAQVAIDPEGMDLISVSQDTAFKIQDTELNKGIFLEKGKVFTSINKLKEGSNFKVYTPAAVAAVRGTQFAVIVEYDTTSVLGYSGHVEVNRRAPDGSATKDSVILNPGEKVIIGADGSGDLKAEEISLKEMADLRSMAEITAEKIPAKEPAKKSDSKGRVSVSSHFGG